MSTNQIFDKVAALKSEEEKSKSDAKKRRGVWAEVETFVDPSSGIGMVVTERVRGRPAFSVQLLHFDDRGGNKHVPIPCDGAQRPVKEILYLLAEKADALIQEKLAELQKTRQRPRKDRRNKDDRREGKPVSGLSELAKRDAEKQGAEYVGKSERKKGKK